MACARRKVRSDQENAGRLECAWIIKVAPRAEENQILRAKESGAWLTGLPSHKNGTILSKKDFTDNIRYRNRFKPNNLPWYCDGCGTVLTTEHGLNCKFGGLVYKRHDATANTWIYLGAQAFQPSVCSLKPMVNESNPRGRGNRGTGAPAVVPVFWRGGEGATTTQLTTQPINPLPQMLGPLKARPPQSWKLT